MSEAPIAATAATLDALDSYAGFDVGTDPGDGWLRLADLESGGHLDGWLAAVERRHVHRGASGSLLGAALARAVVAPTVSSMILDARCPDPAAENLLVRLDDAGEARRYGLHRPTAALLPADARAQDGHSVVVPDEEALLAWWASRAGASLTPLLAAVRARAPFGLRALWGAVADEITGVALWVGQLAGQKPSDVWAKGERMVDALAPRAPVSLPRARAFPVAAPHTGRWFQVRATCCLWYRSATESGPVKDRYCSTCPLRDDSSRTRILRDYLSTVD